MSAPKTIRRGHDAVMVVSNLKWFAIRYGRDGINCTIHLNYSEAGELAQFILDEIEARVPLFDEEEVRKQQKAYGLAAATIDSSYEDEGNGPSYEAERDDARTEYMRVKGNLDWSGRIFLVDMLLAEAVEELEL